MSALGRVLRETWPVDLVVEGTVLGVLGMAVALGAPWTVLLACGLLFGVLAPLLGLFLCWLDVRRQW